MDQMFFQVSSNSDPQNTTPQDKNLDYVLPVDGTSNLHSNMRSRGQQRKLLASDKSENSNDDNKKKLMHRDIERQRRQEMATLYASLRTLLPLEYIKKLRSGFAIIMSLGLLFMGFQGKRAISDHMNGAVCYIKDLQKRIDELSAKRNELKKLSNSSCFDQGMSSNDSFPSSAVVRQSLNGVEVVISTGLGAQALTLSRVLELLLEEGLDVVSCISTRIDGGLIHTIQSEVSDLTYVTVPGLQQKLNEEISSLSQIS
ncbi:PREDICTED: transcription factor bHLH120 isoform X1 [Theobroma cacao]|uniref:Transcription factor bHLH120 isoform X1 n=2 Tax=Theobroma cacao TaxID=3641 RepID=A0AB32VAU6_THECC|nr:PREDICTED: transcription factor bHLH120 isoform X1 [Theobroma cacao]EOY23021.1 Basic helix-loop-helix DNA-binding superfamily protein, putative [Theobroma cacao]